jgi:hypothetical protein
MAILTKNKKYIVEMYVSYFGKAPSVAEIAKYNEFGEPKLILTEIIGDADVIKPKNNEDFVIERDKLKIKKLNKSRLGVTLV